MLKLKWKIAIAHLLIIINHADAQEIAQLSINEPRAVLIVNHASREWDKYESIKFPVNKLVDTFKARNLPVIYLTHREDMAGYYLDDPAPTHKLYSTGGENKLYINSSKIILTGGKFDNCLCEAARNIINGAKNYNQIINVDYIVDAVYQNDTRKIGFNNDESASLQDLTSHLSDTDFANYVKVALTLGSDLFCPNSPYVRFYPNEFKPAPLKEYTFSILRNNKDLNESFGNGPNKVKLNFVNSDELNF